MKLPYLVFICSLTLLACNNKPTPKKINREEVVRRHFPKITSFDTLGSLSVGNGNFAFTVDATGLQTFPTEYKNGIPLGTMSQWGWHSMPNTQNYKFEECLKDYNFGRNRPEPYAVQFKEGREKDAANYFRKNLHRIHLGVIGFESLSGKPIQPDEITNINQKLDLWNGVIKSNFNYLNSPVNVKTACDPNLDIIGVQIKTSLFKQQKLAIKLYFPFPSANHSDDGCDWEHPEKHASQLIRLEPQKAILLRNLDTTKYLVTITWKGDAQITKSSAHKYLLIPESENFEFSAMFSQDTNEKAPATFSTMKNTKTWWNNYWNKGGFVDFSDCKSDQAMELERRIILSQYLMAIQCAGMYPPQETGLTYNSWYGKYHLEMHWWHAVHFALWNRPELLERSLDWYRSALPKAIEIAQRQGFKGVRWMKMTDPVATEAPSKVGSFLIWQQPHLIYFSELLYRNYQDKETLDKYKDLVFETADFMASFVSYDSLNDRYTLNHIIPAQETLPVSKTINPPLELAYWYYGLATAQKWRVRLGMQEDKEWNTILKKLSPLAQKDGLYLASESAPDSYENPRYISDHMAVLGALGMLPASPLVDKDTMRQTLDYILKNWNWDKTWGWDYPLTAMCAVRVGEPQKAIDALLMDKRTNTFLLNGHNFQDNRLRVYLPGNGGLLSAVALMCAGWDGCDIRNPGFPKNDEWNVKWEDINSMP